MSLQPRPPLVRLDAITAQQAARAVFAMIARYAPMPIDRTRIALSPLAYEAIVPAMPVGGMAVRPQPDGSVLAVFPRHPMTACMYPDPALSRDEVRLERWAHPRGWDPAVLLEDRE